MATRPVSFAVEEDEIALLEELSKEFGGGNRSEFLRVAMAEFKEKLRKQKLERNRKGMEELHSRAVAERGGKVYTTEETLRLIDDLDQP